ncbi:MAG: YdcF family protein [Anaerolineae bacterium]
MRIKNLECGAGILALLGVVLFTWLWVQIDRFGQVDRARQADVIVVLGARVWPSGRPSDALTRRTLHAVKLYKEGLAAAIVFSGGLGTHPPTEAQAAARLAMDQGVPPEAVVLEEESHSTEDSAFLVSEIMRARGWQRAIVVSDAYHLWRAKLLFGKAGIEAYPSPAHDERYPLSKRMYLYYLGREVVAVAWYYVKSWLGLP